MKKHKSLLLLLLFPLMLLACRKKDENSKTPYDKTITGVLFRNTFGEPMNTIGVLDTKTIGEDFEMAIYPTPAYNSMSTIAIINNKVELTLTATLVHVQYPDAPIQFSIPGYNQSIVVNIENEILAGTIALSSSKNIPIAQADSSGIGTPGGYRGQNVFFDFNVAALPQGFYRVYIETNDGRRYWDNTCIFRP